ncbi:primosomal protein N' [Candidatus Endomicrobiellum agilis]|uniref:replication restart helicase PriA n=1 Tax=Candidatus Endomicrobiellum agilis TaxID=3238957 RepID=UPI003572EFB4|nr:primosomal protein N' [Endomicrobium sp.]
MIVLELAVPVPLNKTFYYLPPENLNPKNIVGKRVKAQFGKRTLTAYVISCLDVENTDDLKLKRIIEVEDNDSLITEETVEIANYISKNYVCSLGEALASMIPVSMKLPKRIPKNKIADGEEIRENHILNAQQTNAVNLINKNLKKKIYNAFLLYGITASGKTEVYINAVECALKQNRSTIMLFPEISLTTQFVDIMTKRFGTNIGVWHSGISNVEKYSLFSKAKNGGIKIMIGARSAVFAPFENLGLIIVDEEHERAYKQDKKPSYDAREIAKQRGVYHNAVVVLGSATPSLESYKDAIENKLNLIELSERIHKKDLPEVKVLTSKNGMFQTGVLFSETIEAVSKALSRREQVIVFLNRRGYSPVIMCGKCGSVYQCPKCSISMVFHRNPDMLKCHYCGEIKNLPATCSKCKSKDMTVFGTGTQKVENELKKLFKNAKIFRLDGDTASSKGNYEKAYNGMKNEEYDILIGTQMIAKGFDFPRVSLVCVVDADTSLYLPDFKSVEKTFQLITQVAGRSGRGDMRGVVIVQTSHPQHYAIECAKNHDFVSFYKTEIEERKKLFYPPYCDLAKISIRNKEEKRAEEDSEKLFSFLESTAKTCKLNLKLLGPVSAYIAKINNVYRKYIIIKGDRENILELTRLLEDFKQSSGTFIGIEIMPSDLI